MKIQFVSLLLIGILTFTSFTALGGTSAAAAENRSAAGGEFSLSGSNDGYFEYCTVDLADARSNLNVRTWEGRVISKLRHGTQVWVSDYSGEWAKVSVRRGRRWVEIGWVDSNYLLC